MAYVFSLVGLSTLLRCRAVLRYALSPSPISDRLAAGPPPWSRAVVRSVVLRFAGRKGGRRGCAPCADCFRVPAVCARMVGAHLSRAEGSTSMFTSFPDFPGGPRSSPPMQALDDSHRRRRTGGVVLNERGEPVLHWPDVIPDGWSVSRRITAMDAAGMLDSAAGAAGGAAMNLEDVFRGVAARPAAAPHPGRGRHQRTPPTPSSAGRLCGWPRR